MSSNAFLFCRSGHPLSRTVPAIELIFVQVLFAAEWPSADCTVIVVCDAVAWIVGGPRMAKAPAGTVLPLAVGGALH